MQENNNYHAQNRKSWNEATKQHHTHRPDLIERYKAGHNNLYPEEMELLGDIRNKSIVHLQCNDGQDTLSIARHMGANVLGVDISDEAIAFATRMSAEAEITARFERADIFDWFDRTTEKFDVVFTSYGALVWISDIVRWGKGVANVLKSGGRVVIVEFHPLMMIFDYDWSHKYDYMGGKPTESPGVGDYVGDDFEGGYKNPQRAFEFSWGIGEIASSLLDAGLTLTHLKEYPYCNGWKPFPGLVNGAGNRNYLPESHPTIAMMYSIVAERPKDT